MKRLGAIALFAGAVLLSTHLLAPAEPPPPLPGLTAADRAAIAQNQPLVNQVRQVDAQVDRLRERLARPPAYPPPSRDPFRFGQRTESTPSKPPASAPPVVPPPVNPPPVLPHLIAIVTNAADGNPIRTAVLASGDELQTVKAGEIYSSFLVRSISIDGLELTDPATGATFKISLH
jgi:hypothetical protein